MVDLNEDGSIVNIYSNFIAISRYARWDEKKQRRETWSETIDRYMTNMRRMLIQNNNCELTDEEYDNIRNAVVNMNATPSMRALMTMGKAIDSTNVAAYNCSYIPIDSLESFAEMLYILTCGTGVGISVENKYIGQLPRVPEHLELSDKVITVEDSREGWADSLKELMTLLYNGIIPSWDVSLVRQAGERLKTFGGRASGPAVLVELFEFTIDIFKKAQGRKLSAEDCNDICCKIGVIVVAGSVRRSAILTLTDLNDTGMSLSKRGEFWNNNPQRAMSNISAVYNGRPSRVEFDREWDNLVNSGTGERGIFNRSAAQLKASSNGRRSAEVEYGLNPCGEILLNPYQFCNLSSIPIQGHETYEEMLKKIEIATILGTMQATLIDFPYLRDKWQENTKNDRLLGVSMTGVFGHPVLNGSSGKTELKKWLNGLRDHARVINSIWANKLNISPAAAITCIKPEGNTSQLTNTSSGLHPWHSKYYIRTVRSDKKDPLGALLKDFGVPCEDDLMKPEISDVFSFPIAAPPGAMTRKDITAIDHLNLWLMYQQEWCEHNPSVTINVADNEWDVVKEWIWDNFDNAAGISFLPKSDHLYPQAPYQEITEEEYRALSAKMPKVDWSFLRYYETNDDAVKNTKELACTAGSCEIDFDRPIVSKDVI